MLYYSDENISQILLEVSTRLPYKITLYPKNVEDSHIFYIAY